MSRRLQIISLSAALAATLCMLGITVPVPFVSLGPGPTFDVMGLYKDREILRIDGLSTFPVSGHLNMTTVVVSDDLPLISVLWFWISGQQRVLPREIIYPSGVAEEEVQLRNNAQFDMSENNAVAAALTELGLPTRVAVVEVVEGSAADAVLETGDEVVAVGGRPVTSPIDIADRLADSYPGQSISILYRRDGLQHETGVVLDASQSGPQGFLGIRSALIPRDGVIAVSLDGIGGPSAGLMFSLGIVDRLSPGELTGGRFIAGTGAIEPDGLVKPIEGVPFKMLKAREVGAEVFLVPEENCAEASAAAPDGLQLIRVASLSDAIAGLDALREGRRTRSC